MTVVLFVAFAINASASNIDVPQASRVAKNLCWLHGQQAGYSYLDFSPEHSFSRFENGIPVYHVFRLAGKASFIIVAADDNVYPVLAYSFESDLPSDPEQQVPPVKSWLDFYAKQIIYAQQNDMAADQNIQKEWAVLLADEAPLIDAPASSVAPLVTTMWAQGCNYNEQCPATGGVHPAGPCDHVVVGCVATAMAMAMKYWNFPARGSGSTSYTDPAKASDPSYGTISATYNYAYDWDNMPNSVTSANVDVATLGFHAGVSVEMNYSYNSSGAWPVGSTEVADAFKDHFYFSNSTYDALKASYSDATWKNMLKTELNANRVIVYGSDGDYGHAYIMDGYDDNYAGTGNLYFHFNWGWSGSSNGYFQLSNLNPGGANITNNQEAILNLVPKPIDLSYDASFNNLTVSGTTASVSLQVENIGSAPARASVLGYYASTNTIISTGDHRLGADAVTLLTPGNASNESITVDLLNVTSTIPPGNYYIGYLIDYEGDVSESNESNNDYAFSTPQVIMTCKAPSTISASDGTYSYRIYVDWTDVDYANYYQVYRSTTNSSADAIILSSWQESSYYNDYTAIPGVTYYYFVKAATTSSGSYSGPFSAGNSGYMTLGSINEDVTYSFSTNPRCYSYLSSNNYWCAVGIRPDPSTDWDIYLYDDTEFTSYVAASAGSGELVDFVLVDGNHASLTTRGIKLSRYSGLDGAIVEFEGGGDVLYQGTNSSITWPAGDVVEIFDAYLTPGFYRISLTYNSGTANLDLGIVATPAGNFGQRNSLMASSTNLGIIDESLIFNISTSDYYGIIVWANDGNAANYNLRIERTGTWQGDISSDWHTPGNWSGDLVPNYLMDVTIPAGCPNYPLISTDSASCKNITINSGASLEIGAKDFIIYGDMSCYGHFAESSSSSNLFVHGSIDWKTGSTASAVNSSEMYIKGMWTFEEGTEVYLTGGYVEFYGINDSYIRCYDSTCSVNHIRNTKESGYEFGFSNISTADLNIIGNIYNYSGKVLGGYSNYDIKIGGSLQNIGGTFRFIYGNVEFNGNPTLSLKPSAGSYFNKLTINSPSGTLSVINTYSDSLIVKNDLVIQSGTLNPGSMNIVVQGNWDNKIYPNGFTEGASTVHFQDGPWHQYVSSEDFYHLVVNKPDGGAIRIDGGDVTCNQYDWTGGCIDVLSGTFTADDLLDNGIFGGYYVNPGGTINLTNNDGYVDINGNLFIYGGAINVFGGSTASYWPYAANASLTMSDGVLDFKNQGILLYESPSYTMTNNLTGGTIRTTGLLTVYPSNFHPQAGTFEFYGLVNNNINLFNGSSLFNVLINKGSETDAGNTSLNPNINKLKEVPEEAMPDNITITGTTSIQLDADINGDFIIQSGAFNTNNKNMYIAGNWNNLVGESAFNEGTGTVTFDSSESKYIYSDEIFYNLQLDKTYPHWDGLLVDEGKNIGVLNTLNVLDGTLELNTNSTLDVDDDIFINLDAGINAGGLDTGVIIRCGGDWTNLNINPANTIYGFTSEGSSVYFDNNITQSIFSNETEEVFKNLIIDKAAAVLEVNDNITVSGTLNVVSGEWKNNSPGLVHKLFGNLLVTGSWNYTDNPDAILEIKNSVNTYVNYNGTGYPSNVRIRKTNIASDAMINNSNAEQVKKTVPLNTDAATQTFVLNSNFKCINLDIDTGTFDVNGHTLSALNSVNLVNANGSLEINSGSILELDNTGLYLNGGNLEIIGTSASNAQVRSYTPGSFYQCMLYSGYLAAKNASFSGMNTLGVDIYSAVDIDPIYDFDSCTFKDGISGGILLGFDDQSIDIYGASFPSNTYGGLNNVKKYYNSGIVNFIGYTGVFSGPTYESDPFDLVNWFGNIAVAPYASPTGICPGASSVLSANPGGGALPIAYTWSPVSGLNDPNIENPVASPAVSTIYYVTATDALGNTATGSVGVEVYASPVAHAGSDVSIITGGSATLNGSAGGGFGPYSYTWGPVGSLSDPFIANPIATPAITTLYTLTVTDAHGCTSVDDVLVTVLPVGGAIINGYVNYHNASLSGLSGVTVNLLQSGSIVASTSTLAGGFYQFAGLSAGTYDLRCSSVTPWGGVNSADALQIMKHFVHMITLSGIELKAANVDGSVGINAIDALLCARRFTGIVTSFPSGDWAFEEYTITVSGGSPVSQNILGLCYGDANGSYIPPYKSEPAVYFSREGEIICNDPLSLTLPVYLGKNASIGSASLVLSYPSDQYEIESVEFACDNEFSLFNTSDGQLRIAWYTVKPTFFLAGENLFRLKMKARADASDFWLEAGYGSELSDPMAITLENTELTYPKISLVRPGQLSLSQTIPNPVEHMAWYTLTNPEQLRVSCTLYAPDGKAVYYNDFGTLDPGTHQLQLDVSSYSQGTYNCLFEIRGSNENKFLRRSIVIMK